MLVPAPYKVPGKKAKKKAAGTRKGLRCEAAPDASLEDDEEHSSHEGEEEEEEEDAPIRKGLGAWGGGPGGRKRPSA